MQADEERIRSECLESASGDRFPLSDVKVRDLVSRARADLDSWWRVTAELIEAAPDDRTVAGLAQAPLMAILHCGGEPWIETAGSVAHRQTKMALALWDALRYSHERGRHRVWELVGRELTVRTYIRYLVEKPAEDVDFDFWSWEVIHWLVQEQPAEAWEVILDLVATAPSDEVLDIIAASWIEDFIIGWGRGYIETIEAEAKRNPKFKQALSGVWIMKVSQDLFDRVQAAAGAPLRRA